MVKFEKLSACFAQRGVRLCLLSIMIMFISAVGGMLFVLIAGSTVSAIVAFFCAAVLCLLPAFCSKIYTTAMHLEPRRLTSALTLVGFALSLFSIFCYYVGHDYEMSVYRYMKQTDADIYYFGGYESFTEDYSCAEDFMNQMKSAPASIVLESMSEEKIASLTAEELKTINAQSLWDYCGFSDILGSSDAEVEKSMAVSKEMNAYEFTFEYRGLHAKTQRYMLTHPKQMFSELKAIAVGGSHSVRLATLVCFLAVQAFLIVFIGMRFVVTTDKGIIYVSDPFIKRRTPTNAIKPKTQPNLKRLNNVKSHKDTRH